MPKTKTSVAPDREHSLTGEKLALLAVFARAEEEAIGAAGTLAKYAMEGVRVSLVTAAREPAALPSLQPLQFVDRVRLPLREESCSCLASGTQRICLIDRRGTLDITDEHKMRERLVRLIREIRPQVIITESPEGAPNRPDRAVISRLASEAFYAAGDTTQFPQHLRDGLAPYQPQKLYYCLLPQSTTARPDFVERLDARGTPTTVLNVTHYLEARDSILYCQRNHTSDHAGEQFAEETLELDKEYFVLAATMLRRRGRRENDLFAGLR